MLVSATRFIVSLTLYVQEEWTLIQSYTTPNTHAYLLMATCNIIENSFTTIQAALNNNPTISSYGHLFSFTCNPLNKEGHFVVDNGEL